MFRKAAAGELAEDSGLSRLATLTDVDVGEVGVTGAATFFESKVRASWHCSFPNVTPETIVAAAYYEKTFGGF